MASVVGNPLAVVASLFTLFVPALVIRTRECPLKGGTPNDQLAPDSQLPLALLVQLFVLPVAVISRACENSVSPLAVAVTNSPGASGTGQSMVKLPAASVAMFVETSSVLPSPKPDGSAVGLVNNSS